MEPVKRVTVHVKTVQSLSHFLRSHSKKSRCPQEAWTSLHSLLTGWASRFQACAVTWATWHTPWKNEMICTLRGGVTSCQHERHLRAHSDGPQRRDGQELLFKFLGRDTGPFSFYDMPRVRTWDTRRPTSPKVKGAVMPTFQWTHGIEHLSQFPI